MPKQTHHCGVCKGRLTASCLRKGHHYHCPVHPNGSVMKDKECLLCTRDRKRAADAERRKKLEEKEAERKKLEGENDMMNKKGKERKPRNSGSGGSAGGLDEPAW
ncbi:hypothetical protein MMC07_002460 [Pseudocyphellaria aurata]|nr:hypothetical protein [Pseudocyphellaria aurata]